MSYFKQLFEQTLKTTPLVKFITYLKNKKPVNKLIQIPHILNTEFDGYYLMIEYNGILYSWIITDKRSKDDYIEKSNDTFSTYRKCIENLMDVLKNQNI